LASALLRLHAAPGDRLPAFAGVDWDKALTWLRDRTGTSLAPGQEQAVRLALTSRPDPRPRRQFAVSFDAVLASTGIAVVKFGPGAPRKRLCRKIRARRPD